MGRFGVCSGDMAKRIIKAFGAERTTWGKLLVYLADKTTTGDRLPEPEWIWLSEWMKAEGMGDPGRAIVVQITQAQVAREVFDGHPESARRAVAGLESRGILRLAHKGIRGHGSLYLCGFVDEGFNRVTKSAENVTSSKNDTVTKSRKNVTLSTGENTHVFEQYTHVFEELGHNERLATCENASTFNLFKVNSNKESGVKEEGKQCVRCGSENVIPSYGPGLLECRDCNAAFRVSNRKTETRSRDPSRG